jgi:hypothetical protein
MAFWVGMVVGFGINDLANIQLLVEYTLSVGKKIDSEFPWSKKSDKTL